MSPLSQLLSQGKTHFQAKDYRACMAVMEQILKEDPSNTEAAWMMKEAQSQWEDQRSAEEFEIYIENVKKEAIDLFDKERYEQCLGMFRFLLELEPDNAMFRDYVRLSQQMFLETLETDIPASQRVSHLPDKEVNAQEVRGGRIVAQKQAPVPLPRVESTPADPLVSASAADSGVQRAAAAATADPPVARSRVEPISQAEKEQIIRRFLASAAFRQRERRRTAWMVASPLLVAAILVLSLWIIPRAGDANAASAGSLEIQSKPERASVFINDELKGQTRYLQDNLPAGNYEVRVEKQGYLPFKQRLTLKTERAALLVVHLERLQAEREPANLRAAASPGRQTATPATPRISLEPDSSQTLNPIAYSVVHHHSLGSCTGRLSIQGDSISFRPAGSSKDGFRRKITQIESVELGDKLMIQFKDKTYRFESLAGSREENRHRLALLDQQIRRQRSSGKS